MKKIRTKKLHRRTVLRAAGLTGVALALPPLEAMFGPAGKMRMNAQGQTSVAPKRLIVFWWGNGAPMNSFTPSTTGTGWSKTPILEGLAQVAEDPGYDAQADVNIVTGIGLNAILGDTTNHTPDCIAAFTGSAPDQGSATAPSLDKVLGDLIGSDTTHRFLGIALATRDQAIAEGRYSWLDAGSSKRPYISPGAVWDAVFKGYVPPSAEPDPELEALKVRKGSILDYVKGSAERLKNDLGQEDRLRLDAHLESVRQVETALYAEAIECDSHPQSSEYNEAVAGDNGNLNLEARSDLLMSMAVMALRCDLTRVVNFSLGPSAGALLYPGASQGDHAVSHSGSFQDPDPTGEYTAVARWKVSRFARLVKRLKDQQDIEGQLLDNTTVVGLSEMSFGGGHQHENLPMLVAGGGMQTGRHVVFPCSGAPHDVYGYCGSGNTDIRKLWLTAFKSTGADVSSFAGVSETLEGLWI